MSLPSFLRAMQAGCKAILIAVSLILAPAAATAGALPTVDQIQVGDPMVIDGVWIIDGIQKKIMVSGGFGIALEPWTHAFTVHVQRGDVISRDITQTGDATFSAYDYLLKQAIDMTVQPDGSIVGRGRGLLLPPVFTMHPVKLDYPQAYKQLRLSLR